MAIRSRSLPKHSRLGLEKLESRLVPASFFVNNGDVAGLIAAINTANTDGQSDVIHLAKNGSYTLSAVADTSLGATGLPAILADGNLTIQGNGATITRGQSAPLFRLIAVNGGDLTLNRVTLTNGNSDGALPLADGGGIRVEAGSLTVNQCLFENNQTPRLAFPNFGNGGAIGLRPNTVATITDSVFTGNSAFDGGAINSVGATALDLHNCSFINNGALGAEDGLLASDGGAVNISAFTVPTVTSITNCAFVGNFAGGGGAVAQDGGQLTVQHCIFSDNHATVPWVFALDIFGGGAIGTANVQSSISNCWMTGNNASFGGGAIFVGASFGVTTVTNCTISGNTASFGGGGVQVDYNYGFNLSNCTISGNTANGGGGLIVDGGNGTLSGCTVSNNTANYLGGGVFNIDGTLTVSESTISGNQAGLDGGGIDNFGYFFYPAIFTVDSSTISGNQAGHNGGGVANYSVYGQATATLRNSTISGNTAGWIGGGVSATAAINPYPHGTDDVLHNCTVTANTAADGGGIAHDALGTIALNSTIVARNHDSDGSATPDLFGDVTADFSLIGDSTGGAITGAHNLVGTAAHPIDPKLGPLAYNGGLTKTHALLPGSPALNAGANVDGLVFDQRGHGFDRVGGSAADIGAFEAQDHGHDGGDGHNSAMGGDLSSTVKSAESGIINGPQAMSRQDLDILNAAVTRLRHPGSALNGNQIVDNTVFSLYSRPTAPSGSSTVYLADFDFDGDGPIDITDFGQFRTRLIKKLS